MLKGLPPYYIGWVTRCINLIDASNVQTEFEVDWHSCEGEEVIRQRPGIYTIKYHTKLRTPHGKVTKTQENITYKRAKRLAFIKQVTSRLQWTDKKEWQTQNIKTKRIHKRSTAWEQSVKYFYWRANHQLDKKNIKRHETELKWIKILQSPFPLGFNDITYHEGSISKMPDFDVFSALAWRVKT